MGTTPCDNLVRYGACECSKWRHRQKFARLVRVTITSSVSPVWFELGIYKLYFWMAFSCNHSGQQPTSNHTWSNMEMHESRGFLASSYIPASTMQVPYFHRSRAAQGRMQAAVCATDISPVESSLGPPSISLTPVHSPDFLPFVHFSTATHQFDGP